MDILIIISAIAALGAAFIIPPINARFTFTETVKRIEVSYSIFSVILDLIEEKGRFSLAKLINFKFSLSSEALIPKTFQKAKDKSKIKFSNIKLEYIKLAGKLIHRINIKRLEVKIRGGFTEPFNTGKWYGYYWAARGIYPNLMSLIDFKPDFSSGQLKFEGYGHFSITIYSIIIFIFIQLADKIKRKIKNIMIINKRGTEYA